MNGLFGIFYIGLWIWILRALLSTNQQKVSFQFFNKKDPAEEAIKFLWKLQVGEIKEDVPQYKFFTGLIKQLVSFKKDYGGDITEQIGEMRNNIRIDQKLSKRVKSIYQGTIFQYLSMSGFVLVFLITAQKMIYFEVEFVMQVGLIAFLVLGLFFLFFIFYNLERKYFSNVTTYIHSIYLFSNLMSLQMPFNLAIKKSKIEELPSDKSLEFLRKRIVSIVECVHLKGHISHAEFKLLITENWDVYELQCEKFEKMLSVLKLFLMVIFILPSFLAVIYFIMSSLVI